MEKVLFICNGIALLDDANLGMSGGDSRFFEIIKNSSGIEKHIMAAYYGDKIIEKLGIKYDKKYIINYRVDPGIKSNLVVSLKSLFQFPHGLNKFNHGIVYSSCEHLYDVFPALRLKIFNKCQWYAVYHWVEDYPWKENRGGTPFLIRYLYWLNRWFAGFLIKLFADKILAVSDPTKEKLIKMKGISDKRIKAVYCGVNFKEIAKLLSKYKDEKETEYDAVYMKRLSHGKGAFDLIKIWTEVCRTKKDAKLAIIGHGSKDALKSIRKLIDDNKLQKNISLLGPIYNFEEKFRTLNKSKLFLLPSYEENWAIVIGEAMAIKLPVICYNLKEIVPIWKDNVSWINLGDTKGFAQKVVTLLDNKKERNNFSEQAFSFIEHYDWKKIAEKEFKD